MAGTILHRGSITDVAGILVGHADDPVGLTGVTAVLAPEGAVIGVSVEGSAPGTRETDLCRPGNLVQKAHAVLLCGGSAFGLAAADGAMQFLAERQIGFPTAAAIVPIVPAAVLYDLSIGDPAARPTAAMGYRACEAASSQSPLQGCHGAGMGCTAGKILGIARATKTGIGTASLKCGAITVGAIVAVNCFGDVSDPSSGQIIAGARLLDDSGFADSTSLLLGGSPCRPNHENTTIGVVAVGGRLSKEEVNKVARMAHDGLARTISPIHTLFDGDALFCLATGEHPADVNSAGTAAALAVQEAVLMAVKSARALGGLPAAE